MDNREHVAVVVPREHLNREVASDWVPDLVPDSCPRGRVSSRRNDEAFKCHPQGMASYPQ